MSLQQSRGALEDLEVVRGDADLSVPGDHATGSSGTGVGAVGSTHSGKQDSEIGIIIDLEKQIWIRRPYLIRHRQGYSHEATFRPWQTWFTAPLNWGALCS